MSSSAFLRENGLFAIVETTVSTDTSANATPMGSGMPTGTVIVPGQDVRALMSVMVHKSCPCQDR
ncbi:hypothetical protein DFH11DRAFT_1626503 [Phellopilus nigrolimitatus]|nr:hypothetical protein DFH11DRAFT_1626503 [Phellopilus nigrolimitatus]